MANGRAYGDGTSPRFGASYVRLNVYETTSGVYFAKNATVSMDSYSQIATTIWPSSCLGVRNCAVVAEIVNLPERFVSTSPYFVVAQTEWIVW